MIKEMFDLENVTIKLEVRTSKNNTEYNACILVYEDNEFMLGFEKEYYSLRKRFNKK